MLSELAPKDDGKRLDTIESFDLTNQKFSPDGPKLPVPLALMTGRDDKHGINLNTFSLETEEQTWTSIITPHLNTPQCGYNAVVLQNNIIAVCGGIEGLYGKNFWT